MACLRRMLAVVLCVLCMAGASAEELLCVATENLTVLLDADGEEMIAPGEYEDVFCVAQDERYAVGIVTEAGMRYALCDAQGQLLTDFLYTMFQASDGVILCRRDGLCGALDMDGNELLPAMYTQLVTIAEGLFFALTTDPYDDSADEILLVSFDQEEFPTGVRTAIGLQTLVDGRMLYRAPDTERYGYLDASGVVVVPPIFEYAGSFDNGIARASEDGKLGVIGPDGQWRIAPKYDFLEADSGVIVCLEGRERCVVYDVVSCEERYRIYGVNLRVAAVDGRVVVVDDNSMRVFDEDGVRILETDVDATVSPGAGSQMLLSDGEWGAQRLRIVREDGTVGEQRYQHLLLLDDQRYAFVTMRVAAYYSDALDEIRYSCDYDSMRYGLMDVMGNEILPAEYLEIRRLGENRYLTVAEDGLRVIDGDGAVLWSRIEEEA